MSREEQAYSEWVKEEKARIFRMTNERRKQEAWDRLFPKPIYPAEFNNMVW